MEHIDLKNSCEYKVFFISIYPVEIVSEEKVLTIFRECFQVNRASQPRNTLVSHAYLGMIKDEVDRNLPGRLKIEIF